jgi:hypothetical protein
MPVKIFCVEGNELIGGLESEINKWQKSLGSKASVTHTSTAMTEHNDEAKGLADTIGSNDLVRTVNLNLKAQCSFKRAELAETHRFCSKSQKVTKTQLSLSNQVE